MSNPRGKGLAQWQKTLTAEDRTRIGKAGGRGRAWKLSARRRRQIALMGGRANRARLARLNTLKS